MGVPSKLSTERLVHVSIKKGITKSAIKNQLLVVPAGNKVVRMVPPLVISREEIEELLKKLEDSLLKDISNY